MAKSLRQKIEGMIKSIKLAWTLYSACPSVTLESNPEPLVDTLSTEDYISRSRLEDRERGIIKNEKDYDFVPVDKPIRHEFMYLPFHDKDYSCKSITKEGDEE